ncbi:MAG: hydrogenase iron-sulfur subunit, partial [Promethearchaeota archaeon]
MSKTKSQTDKIEKKEEWQPKILAFLCNWCSYAGADLAGVSRIQYPSNIRIVRVPCSGRINPYFIIKTLTSGWDGVIVSGCHPGDCHYISGNLVARRR